MPTGAKSNIAIAFALVFTFFTANGALAAIANVTAVRIESSNPNGFIGGLSNGWIQLSEVVAIAGGSDVALTTAGATPQFSGFPDFGSSEFAPLNKIAPADCNTAGPGDCSEIFHSNSRAAGTYYQVNFDAAYTITELTLYGRSDDGLCSGGCGARDVWDVTILGGSSHDIVLAEFFEQDASGAGNFVTVIPEVPLPAAAWLFISALGGLVAARRKQR